VWHWPLGSVTNIQILKETRQRLVISGYYYTQSINKSQDYNIGCDGYILWSTHVENLLQPLQRTLAKIHFWAALYLRLHMRQRGQLNGFSFFFTFHYILPIQSGKNNGHSIRRNFRWHLEHKFINAHLNGFSIHLNQIQSSRTRTFCRNVRRVPLYSTV